MVIETTSSALPLRNRLEPREDQASSEAMRDFLRNLKTREHRYIGSPSILARRPFAGTNRGGSR